MKREGTRIFLNKRGKSGETKIKERKQGYGKRREDMGRNVRKNRNRKKEKNRKKQERRGRNGKHL